MAKKRIYAHILLDRSGSMASNIPQTIDAINEYINGLKAQEDVSARISLTLFDLVDGIDLSTVRDNVKAKECELLTRADYTPRGTTPLNDAIGKVVAQIDAQTRREGENVVLVIMTDGLENASREYTKEAVKGLLDSRKAAGWLVIYLGADHDAFAASASYGIAQVNTMSFDKLDPQTNAASMQGAARATASYARTGVLASAAFTAGERVKAVKKAR